ncbi:phospholipase A2 inhibitor NAI-like [Eublepharis macularius]|uniref:Phospholipase A2 inhibitor NAI-like n=1 Tax=Eublepharis macularius TaxID=481883 RepID=A0AA97LHY3_EUBMA|nr:phospholipase A2 inhibitor NAI-like [Eublepharis macularius]XP_054856066.1 phospholipase A2 inhibitor NAI-like [Eublepharis macularius]
MKALLSTCLLFGLFSPVALMECYSCTGEECATPKIKSCRDDQDACVSAVSNVKMGEFLPELLIPAKRCGKTQDCLDTQFSMQTEEGGRFRSIRECCFSDKCNNVNVSLSEPVEHPPNQILCPSCFDLDSENCTEGGKVMICTGDETKCVEGVIEMKISLLGYAINMFIQGCGTPSMCTARFPMESVSSGETKFNIKGIRCIDGIEYLTV